MAVESNWEPYLQNGKPVLDNQGRVIWIDKDSGNFAIAEGGENGRSYTTYTLLQPNPDGSIMDEFGGVNLTDSPSRPNQIRKYHPDDPIYGKLKGKLKSGGRKGELKISADAGDQRGDNKEGWHGANDRALTEEAKIKAGAVYDENTKTYNWDNADPDKMPETYSPVAGNGTVIFKKGNTVEIMYELDPSNSKGNGAYVVAQINHVDNSNLKLGDQVTPNSKLGKISLTLDQESTGPHSDIKYFDVSGSMNHDEYFKLRRKQPEDSYGRKWNTFGGSLIVTDGLEMSIDDEEKIYENKPVVIQGDSENQTTIIAGSKIHQEPLSSKDRFMSYGDNVYRIRPGGEENPDVYAISKITGETSSLDPTWSDGEHLTNDLYKFRNHLQIESIKKHFGPALSKKGFDVDKYIIEKGTDIDVNFDPEDVESINENFNAYSDDMMVINKMMSKEIDRAYRNASNQNLPEESRKNYAQQYRSLMKDVYDASRRNYLLFDRKLINAAIEENKTALEKEREALDGLDPNSTNYRSEFKKHSDKISNFENQIYQEELTLKTNDNLFPSNNAGKEMNPELIETIKAHMDDGMSFGDAIGKGYLQWLIDSPYAIQNNLDPEDISQTVYGSNGYYQDVLRRQHYNKKGATPVGQQKNVFGDGSGGSASGGSSQRQSTGVGGSTSSTRYEKDFDYTPNPTPKIQKNKGVWEEEKILDINSPETREYKAKESGRSLDDINKEIAALEGSFGPEPEKQENIMDYIDPGYVGDIAQMIGGVSGIEDIPRYTPSKQFEEYQTMARQMRDMGLTEAEKAYAEGQLRESYIGDVENIKRMSGGSGGTALANLGRASRTYQQGRSQLAMADRQARRENRQDFYRAARDYEPVHRQIFDDDLRQAELTNRAASELMAAGIYNMDNRIQYNKTYGPNSDYAKYMHNLAKTEQYNADIQRGIRDRNNREYLKTLYEDRDKAQERDNNIAIDNMVSANPDMTYIDMMQEVMKVQEQKLNPNEVLPVEQPMDLDFSPSDYKINDTEIKLMSEVVGNNQVQTPASNSLGSATRDAYGLADSDYQRLFDFESSHGLSSGGHPSYGMNVGDKQHLDYLRSGNITPDLAKRYIQEEILGGKYKDIYDKAPRDVKLRLMDWEYNTGRSARDLILAANGFITGDELDDDLDPEVWNKFGVAAMEGLNMPDFHKRLDKTKDLAYQRLAKRRNQQNDYQNVWGPRTRMWNDDFDYDNWQNIKYD